VGDVISAEGCGGITAVAARPPRLTPPRRPPARAQPAPPRRAPPPPPRTRPTGTPRAPPARPPAAPRPPARTGGAVEVCRVWTGCLPSLTVLSGGRTQGAMWGSPRASRACVQGRHMPTDARAAGCTVRAAGRGEAGQVAPTGVDAASRAALTPARARQGPHPGRTCEGRSIGARVRVQRWNESRRAGVAWV
jgi:hypothetical protein